MSLSSSLKAVFFIIHLLDFVTQFTGKISQMIYMAKLTAIFAKRVTCTK